MKKLINATDNELLNKEKEEKMKRNLENVDESKFIEKNLNSITTVKYDLAFDVDPFFQKTSSLFDESGVNDLLLMNLNVIVFKKI